jgi:subfamily B ATP-binding cassette protein MsbA
LPVAFYRTTPVGELVSRTTGDIGEVRQFLGGHIANFIKDPLILLIGIVLLFFKIWLFTLELLGVGLVILALMHFLGEKIRTVSRRVQERLGDLTGMLAGSLFSVEVIRLFGRERFHRMRFSESLDGYLGQLRRRTLLESLIKPVNEILSFLAAALVTGTGIWLISAGRMAPNELAGFIFYLAVLSSPLHAVTNMAVQYRRAAASAARVFEILDTPGEETRGGGRPLPALHGRVEFRAVCFSYRRGEPVLAGIDLVAEPGEMVAIVGASGSGKTTLVSLIPRLLDPQKGRVLLDGIDTRRVDLASLRSQIGMVSQDNVLFPGTVRENIRYGRLEADDGEVVEAARLAQAEEFIEKFPLGYDTPIGERGLMLSGGQRQRLALARVVLRRPRILILDEATSALDAESEQLVQRALATILHRQTTFVVAHRLSTIRHADRIIVLDGGVIAEQGAHRALLARRGSLYRKLHEILEDGTRRS